MLILVKSEQKDWNRERKIVSKREEGSGCRKRRKRSNNAEMSLPSVRRRRERLEKLLSAREELRRTLRTAQSSRRSRRRSGRRRPRLSAGCRSRGRRTGRRPEATGEAETALSQAAGAELLAETMDQEGMMVPGVMTDPGGMGLRGLEVDPPGNLAAAAGETGSRKRMRSGDQGAAPEEAPLPGVVLLQGVDLHLDVAHLLVRTGEMQDPGGVEEAEEAHHPGEMIEVKVEAASREEVVVAVTLEIAATGTCAVEDLLVVMIVETVEALTAGIVMAEMVAAAPGEEEAVIVKVEIVRCAAEVLLLAVMIVTCVVDLLGMMIVATEDLPAMMDPVTGAVDLPVMTVTCDVDPLVMMDLVDPLVTRDRPEKMMAGQLSRPSVNSQLPSRFINRVRACSNVRERAQVNSCVSSHVSF